MAKEYVPKVWENYKTPILDEDLNHIEKGLKEVTDGLNSEIQNRKSESNAFKNDLRSESNVREETDNSLAEMISSEATARVASVEKESEDRKNAIRAEAQERMNADTAINKKLDDHAADISKLKKYELNVDSEGYICLAYRSE